MSENDKNITATPEINETAARKKTNTKKASTGKKVDTAIKIIKFLKKQLKKYKKKRKSEGKYQKKTGMLKLRKAPKSKKIGKAGALKYRPKIK